jgi:hypothetical protein
MASCGKCGNALEEGQKVCSKCGESVAGTAASAAGTPAAASAQGGGKRRLGLWIGLATGVVVLALACGLVFGVFWDKIAGDSTGAASPQEAVESLMSLMENKDVEAYFDLWTPESLTAMQAQAAAFGMNMADLKQAMSEDMFNYDSVEFTGVEMETVMADDNTATVTVTAGEVTRVLEGESTTEPLLDPEAPSVFPVVRVDGRWYVDFAAMGQG